MKKGFATTGVLYTLFIIGLLLLVSFLFDLQGKKNLLDTIKNQTENNLNKDVECSAANKEINNLKKEYNALLKINTDLKNKLASTNAEKKEILDGKIAYTKGNIVTGIMENLGTVNTSLKAGEIYTLKEGFIVSGQIKGVSLASQTVATATSNDILEGYTAWVNGQLITGNNKGYDNGFAEGSAIGYDQGYANGMKGTATASDVLSGKTFTNSQNINNVGTMKIYSSINITLNKGEKYSIPKGYHDGTEVVQVN